MAINRRGKSFKRCAVSLLQESKCYGTGMNLFLIDAGSWIFLQLISAAKGLKSYWLVWETFFFSFFLA